MAEETGFETRFGRNPKDRFSRDKAQILLGVDYAYSSDSKAGLVVSLVFIT